MNVNSEFENICVGLTNITCSDKALNLIKENFRDAVNSDRVFAKINNICFLLKILRKRDYLNEEDLSALHVIATVLRSNYWIVRIDDYKSYQSKPELPLGEIRNVLPPIPADPENKVFHLICTEIGQKWKDLARNLKIKEGYIDSFECDYQRISNIVREILYHHKTNCDQRYWRVELCDALIKSRRKDLSLKVQRIFACHNLM